MIAATARHIQCPVTDYAARVATTRKTPQRTVGVDNELWRDCHAIAKVKRVRVSDVLRGALVEFREENRVLLDEIKANTETDD